MLSALDLVRRIDAGALTPAAVVDLCAEAIAKREPEIGAFVALDIARARRFAETSADALKALPLRGLPVGFKDLFDTTEFPTEYGTPIYAGHRPVSDAPLVVMTHRAGGILLGKTVTTELAHMHPGRTRNPHNPAHTPGGSSSGSAAAVAAGMLPIAFGTQTGGSVIRPGAFCGVAAFKPSYKLLPTVGVKCFSWHLDTAGVFGASVADVAFVTGAITGRDLRVDGTTPSAPRIALARTHVWTEASDAMKTAVETAARQVEKAGARVTELTLPPIFEEAWRDHAVIQHYEAFRAFAFEYDQHRDKLSPAMRTLLAEAADVTAEAYDAARRTSRRARRMLADLMADADVLLTPSAPGAAPAGLGSTGSPMFNRLWTLMGSPCVNVPGLVEPSLVEPRRADAAGLPLGVQIVGRFGRDRDALAAAAFVEQAVA
jgi:Asp-tRNA(Asn)/Glu-tRNA(Gln) amidotransferase A subunit family amidase